MYEVPNEEDIGKILLTYNTFEGMQLPGGVIINGRQLFDDAQGELQDLRERIRLEHEAPIDFFIG